MFEVIHIGTKSDNTVVCTEANSQSHHYQIDHTYKIYKTIYIYIYKPNINNRWLNTVRDIWFAFKVGDTDSNTLSYK